MNGQHYLKCLAFCLLVSITYAKAGDTLRIGDPAPVIQTVKWLKGTPVTRYEKDKLYVLEFWATWCGPCKAAMPHLSELAAKYAGKAVFVGIDIWEKTGDKPYESALPAVEQFVKNMGDDMAYNVAADNKSQYMANRWMKAAGLSGIPATFLIKEGNIIWIGHPSNLEEVMDNVISGKFDEAKFASEYSKKASASAAAMAGYMAILQPVNDALEAKDYKKAIAEIDRALTRKTIMDTKLRYMKFTTLLEHFSEQQALDFAKEWRKEQPAAENILPDIISRLLGLSKDMYTFALECAAGSLSKPGTIIPQAYHLMATLHAEKGDFTNAVACEEKAIKEGKDALASGKYASAILPGTIKGFEDALLAYKAGKLQ